LPRSAPTELYTLSLHDALPILEQAQRQPEPQAGGLFGRLFGGSQPQQPRPMAQRPAPQAYGQAPQGYGQAPQGQGHAPQQGSGRSEEHTSELQSRENLVCRLLL